MCFRQVLQKTVFRPCFWNLNDSFCEMSLKHVKRIEIEGYSRYKPWTHPSTTAVLDKLSGTISTSTLKSSLIWNRERYTFVFQAPKTQAWASPAFLLCIHWSRKTPQIPELSLCCVWLKVIMKYARVTHDVCTSQPNGIPLHGQITPDLMTGWPSPSGQPRF